MISINGHTVKPTIFPDGTSQVWQLPETCLIGSIVQVCWRFENESEFMHLAQLRDLIDDRFKEFELLIPYLPYARQDKPTSNTSTFALYTFAKLLNSLAFTRIYCLDAHSSTAAEQIENLKSEMPIKPIIHAIKTTTASAVCYPDGGAKVKYKEALLDAGVDLPIITAQKVRNQLTGEISRISFSGCGGNRDILIVDDICDGGRTFVQLADELQAENPSSINLYVTHGLFSKGLDVLRSAGINRIFTSAGEVK